MPCTVPALNLNTIYNDRLTKYIYGIYPIGLILQQTRPFVNNKCNALKKKMNIKTAA